MHFPTPPIGFFTEGGTRVVTDKQKRGEREAIAGLQHTLAQTFRVLFQAVDRLNTADSFFGILAEALEYKT